MLSEKTTAAVQDFLAEQKLSAAIAALFQNARPLPEARIQTIDSFGTAEDGRTFVMLCTLEDESTWCVSARSGLPLSVACVS